MGEKKEEIVSSLDLIEECYQTIYQLRKLSKQFKQNQRNFTTRTLLETGEKLPEQDEQINGSNSSRTISRVSSTSLSRTNSMNDQSDGSRSSRPSNTQAPPLTRTSSKLSNSPQKRQDNQSGDNGPGNGSPSGGKSIGQGGNGRGSTTSSGGGFSMGFNSLEDQKNDKEATDIYEAFKKELRHWWNTNPTKRNDEDLRGDLADDLTERFLCQRLDPLPPSRVVTNIRKTISHVIEDFASKGILPTDIVAPPEEEKIQEPLTKYAKEKQMKELQEIAEKNERKEKYQKELQASSALRVEQEKKRIKEQYESYMKLKNQTKVVEQEDDKREKELESHLDDIRSLISSIKGTS